MTAQIETPSVPTSLYRYRSLGDGMPSEKLAQELEAIRSNCIWCGSYDSLNDVMEGTLQPSYLQTIAPALYGPIAANVSAEIASYGIASFSETYTHDPMWAYYANNFNGIVIEYIFKSLLDSLPNGCSFVRMNYSEQAPLHTPIQGKPALAAKAALSTKNPKWLVEREWRLISPTKGLVKFGSLRCMRRIYIGSRVSEATEKFVVERVRETHSRTEFMKMRIKDYNMEFEKIPFPTQARLVKTVLSQKE